jgi:hypothetical protein
MRIALPVPGTERKMLMEECIRVKMPWHVAGLRESDCGLRSGMKKRTAIRKIWLSEPQYGSELFCSDPTTRRLVDWLD